MKKLTTALLALGAVTTMSACAAIDDQAKLNRALETAKRAEAKADAALEAITTGNVKAARRFKYTQSK